MKATFTIEITDLTIDIRVKGDKEAIQSITHFLAARFQARPA